MLSGQTICETSCQEAYILHNFGYLIHRAIYHNVVWDNILPKFKQNNPKDILQKCVPDSTCKKNCPKQQIARFAKNESQMAKTMSKKYL